MEVESVYKFSFPNVVFFWRGMEYRSAYIAALAVQYFRKVYYHFCAFLPFYDSHTRGRDDVEKEAPSVCIQPVRQIVPNLHRV